MKKMFLFLIVSLIPLFAAMGLNKYTTSHSIECDCYYDRHTQSLTGYDELDGEVFDWKDETLPSGYYTVRFYYGSHKDNVTKYIPTDVL